MNGVCQRDQLTCDVFENPRKRRYMLTQKGKQTMLYFKRVAILEVNFTEIKASVTLFACCFITQFCENARFSIEMDPHM